MDGRAQTIPHVLRLLLGFVVLSAVAGLMLAGLAIPAVGAIGSTTKAGVAAFDDLPEEFTISPLAQGSKIIDASGGLIANPYDENRIVVPLDRISPWMQKAQIAIEDSRFYEHGGLDPRGFTRAMLSNLGGGEIQGASTLTQQYVKITLQENALRRDDKEAAKAATEKSYMRKLQELKYALNVEQNYTKDQILAGYLNLVYYGDQAYGVEAAAQNYFGISADKLNLNQSALLAGIVQQPGRFDPVQNPKAAQARRDVVLDRMVATGVATPAQAAAAKKIDVKSMIHKKPVKGVCHRSKQPYICTYVLEYLKNSPQLAVLGKTPAERLKNINQGGLTIRTTFNPKYQAIAQAQITKAVPINNTQGLGGAVTIIEPGTGKVLAMAQASSFTKQQVNWNSDQRYAGGVGFQIGSTAKMYALVTALEKGRPLNSRIYAPFASQYQPYAFPVSEMHDKCNANKDWEVRNDYPVGGNLTLADATRNSINTAFAQLVIDLGGCTVHDTMGKMGLHSGNGEPVAPTISSITLGAAEVTPMTLAASYATLAAQGKYCEPTPIVSITTFDKKTIKVPPTKCTQVVPKEVAAGVDQLLEGPLRNGTATGANWDFSRPAAGKTGTTDRHNQSWFVGYTPQLSTAVWIGFPIPADSHGNTKTLNGHTFGDYGYQGQMFGGTVAAPVWGKIMRAASEGMPVVQFPEPSDIVLHGDLVPIPAVFGMSRDSAMATLRDAGFSAYVAGQIASGSPRGTVLGTEPRGQAVKGSSVGIYVSTGQAPAPPPAAKPKPSKSATPAKPTTPAKPGKSTPPRKQ